MADGVARRIEQALSRTLGAGCEGGVFPGASASVAFYAQSRWHQVDVAVGVRVEGGDFVTPETFYDLASLTKPWVAMTALRLHQAGDFELNAPLVGRIPEAKDLAVGLRTWEEILCHRAGLDAWHPFYESIPGPPGSEQTQAWIVESLLLRWDPGRVGTSVYSDLGYILAGIGLSRAAALPLDVLVAERVAIPLGLEDEAFFGAGREDRSWVSRCSPTGRSAWRGRELLAEVHDDNCAALGGIAGHAGMFGTARALASFGAAWVAAWHGRRGALDEEAIRFATAKRPGGSHRLGWDGATKTGSSAGSRIDPDSFGHLGFTGTSLWCDPRRQLVIVLLTNRVAVSDDNAAIRAFRPTFHDAVVAAFDES
jgi:CubicO group peptidase (beta-lactamase class C family)